MFALSVKDPMHPVSSSRSFRFLLLGLLLVMLSSSSVPRQAYAASTSWSTSISGFAFHPSSAILTQGVNATWTNNDLVVYTLWFTNATNGSTYMLSPPISPSASWSHVFNSTGLLKYYDFDRLWINGSLDLLPSTSVGGAVMAVDKLALLAPYIGGLAVLAAATVITRFHLNRVKSKESNEN